MGMGNWVIGYVNGVNAYNNDGRDFLLATDPNAIVAWVDNYCRSNPLEHIFDAAHALVDELLVRAERK
jgi:hypothetical protein